MRGSSTVLLQFTQPKIPEEVRVGYFQFKVKQYIPKPLRCFKCNRYGHVANYCKGKERCSNCGGDHSWKNCDSPNKRCPNCKGNYSAANTACPPYERELVKVPKAQWPEFSRICEQNLSSININHLHVSQLYSAFETTLLEDQCSTLPQTKPFHKISVPRWNKSCEVAVKNKNMLYIVRDER